MKVICDLINFIYTNTGNFAVHGCTLLSWAFNIQIQSQNTVDQIDELEHNHLPLHCCI